MGIINYGAELKVLVASKGHPYAKDGFSDMLDSLPDMACTVVEQPASQAFIDPARLHLPSVSTHLYTVSPLTVCR